MIRLVLLRLTESYFRHRWLYWIPVVIMTAVAVVYPFTLKSTFVVRGTIYIQNETLLSSLTALTNEGFGWVTPAQATTGEMNELFNTDAFVRAIIQQTDLDSNFVGDPEADGALIREARSAIWVQPLGNNLVAVSARHENPRVAHQLASAIINTYVQWKINLGLEGSVAAQTFFVDLVEGYRAELEPVRRELTEYLVAHEEPLRGERPAPEAAEIARLQAAVDQVLERLRNAETKEENARLAMVQTESDVRQTYFTVDEPIMPVTPERSLKRLILVAGLCVAAGVVLSLVAIAGGALLDPTYRFPIDVRHGLDLPVVGMVPEAGASQNAQKSQKTASERTPAARPAVFPPKQRPQGHGAPSMTKSPEPSPTVGYK